MFYPFNAHVATADTKRVRTIRKDEDAILLDSYLSIAHVYIQRAISRGNNQTYVYCPYALRNKFAETLRTSGFIVEQFEHNVTHFLVKWEEE